MTWYGRARIFDLHTSFEERFPGMTGEFEGDPEGDAESDVAERFPGIPGISVESDAPEDAPKDIKDQS